MTRAPGATHDGVEARAHEAARRGANYLLDRADAMPATWRLEVFSSLARLLPDGDLADRARTLALEARAKPVAELPPTLTPNDLRWHRTLRPVLRELVRRHDASVRSDPLRDQLAVLLRDHEDKLYEKLNPTQKLVTLHQLARLDIETRLSEGAVVAALHARWQHEPHATLLADPGFLFGVTHIVIIRSGYFERHVDAEAHRIEREILDFAAQHFAEGIPDEVPFVDIAGEVVVARRLLGLPETDASRAIVRQLVERQEDDGRWGEQRFQRDVHATLVAVEALSPWAQPLRARALDSAEP